MKRYSYIRETSRFRIYWDNGTQQYVETGRGDNDDYKDDTEEVVKDLFAW